MPSLSTLLARAAGQVRREDGPLARAVALDGAQQELVLGGGPGALDLRGVGCVVWGGSVPGGAPKKCRGRRRSQRARECGSPRRAVRRVCGGRGLSRPRDSGVRDLTGGGVWKERRAGEKAAPPSPAALRSRRKAVRAVVRRTVLGLGPSANWRCVTGSRERRRCGCTTIEGPFVVTLRFDVAFRSAIWCKTVTRSAFFVNLPRRSLAEQRLCAGRRYCGCRTRDHYHPTP